MEAKKLSIRTIDGFDLAADDYNSESSRVVICLHQMRRDKSSYREFANVLVENGYRVIALDFRGFGESSGDQSQFSETDFQNMFNDVMAADEFVRGDNPKAAVQLIGASIGANTALRYQEMNTVASVILLSPGLNYHGINPTDANLSNIACPIFYINSEADADVEETKQLFESSPLTSELKKLEIYPGNAHGTELLKEGKVRGDVVEWLNAH